VSVPRFDVAASAGPGSIAESEIGTGHYAFNKSWLDQRGLKTNHLAVIAVRGDSMEPELYDGDLILLDRSSTEPRDGDMFVVRYSDELFVKRVQKMPERHIALRSTNNFYESIRIDPRQSNDLTFIGKVVASMHEW
jgi:phage repressor protein C with HTH and peptisase S24 domain